MGMFDKPQYLTGDQGFVSAGETFWLHKARIDGTVNVSGRDREQVKLLVSRAQNSDQVSVFSSGAGIVNQVRRMDDDDRRNLPVEVRLDQVPSRHGNPTFVLTPASDAPPATAPVDEDIPF